MDNVSGVLIRFKDQFLTFTNVPGIKIGVIDIIEILIISVLFYHILLWIKTTRAWNLFKGLIIILLFVLVAALFQMDTILWLAEKLFNIGLVALVVIFQPELRNALENIGGKTFLGDFFNTGRGEIEKFSDKTIDELVRACFAMGRVKTGALIVMEDEINLGEYIRTGIDVDAILTSQLPSIFLRKIHRFMTERLSCVATVWCQLHVTFRYQTACHSRRIWEPDTVQRSESAR